MDDTTTFDLGELAPVDRYKLLSGLIVPRPIGWVGTADADGRRNLAPYSFFNMVVGTPPTVLFCPGFHGRMKDSLANAIATGEFTLNMVTEGTVEAMNATSGDYPPDVDEFEIAGLTAVPGTVVSAPMVGEAVASMECRTTQVVDVGDPITASVVFGEVLRVHVMTDLVDGTRIDHQAFKAVGRMAGSGYVRTGDLFEIDRPVV